MAQSTTPRASKNPNKSSTTKALTAGKPGMRFPPLSYYARNAFRSSAQTRRSRLIVFSVALSATLLGEYLTIHGYTGLGRLAFLLAMCVLLAGAVGDVKGVLGDQHSTCSELELRMRAVVAVVMLEIAYLIFVLAELLGSYGRVYGAAVVFLRSFGAGYMAYGCVLAVRVRRARCGGGRVEGV